MQQIALKIDAIKQIMNWQFVGAIQPVIQQAMQLGGAVFG
jgi:hypothetical protein